MKMNAHGLGDLEVDRFEDKFNVKALVKVLFDLVGNGEPNAITLSETLLPLVKSGVTMFRAGAKSKPTLF